MREIRQYRGPVAQRIMPWASAARRARPPLARLSDRKTPEAVAAQDARQCVAAEIVVTGAFSFASGASLQSTTEPSAMC